MTKSIPRGTSGLFTVHFEVNAQVFEVLTALARKTAQSPNTVARAIVQDWLTTVVDENQPPIFMTQQAPN